MHDSRGGPSSASLVGVARDATTLIEVVQAYADCGFDRELRAVDGARLQCMECRVASLAASVAPEALRRLEGASDPADMLAVFAVTCPACGAHGVYVANYGPEASPEDAAVLRDLKDPPPPPDETSV